MKFFIGNFTITSLQPVLDNEHSFTFIRFYLLNRPTITEYELASRIANAINPQDHDATDDSLVRAQINKKSKWIDNLIVHYTHEARLESYKRDIHQLWHHTFAETSVMNTKLIIGNRNNQNYKATLVHRRPHRNDH
jgi:hypothetical protein